MNKISIKLLSFFALLLLISGLQATNKTIDQVIPASHTDQFWPFTSSKPPVQVQAPIPDSAYFYQYLTGHNVFTNTIQLRDGSTWYGPYNTGLIASQWLGSDPVILSPNKQDPELFTFCATNQRTGEFIKLNLGDGPYTNGPYTRFITAVDGNGVIQLSDGSFWTPSAFDKKVISDWWIYDAVIIGLNHNKDSNIRPNIIINVAKRSYAMCTFTP